MKNKTHDEHILVEFKYIVLAILLGSIAGHFLSDLGNYFVTIGNSYLALIQLCIIPIVLITVISSFEKIIRHKSNFPSVGKIFLLFIIGGLIAALWGLGIGYIAKPGLLREEDKIILGKALISLQENSSLPLKVDKNSFMDFLSKIIPKNIFESLSKGNIASVIIFGILFGVTLGSLPSKSAKSIGKIFDIIFETFYVLAKKIIRFLPIGVFFIFSGQISHLGFSIIKHLLILISVIYLALLMLVILHTFLMQFYCKVSFLKIMDALKEALLVGFSTSSSFIAMPIALNCLQNHLKVNKLFSDLTFPVGLSISPQGGIVFIAITIMAFSQMFEVALGVEEYLIAIIGSVIFAASAVGIPGGVVAFYPIYLALGIPPELAISILLIIDPFLDQMITLTTIHANCGVTAIGEKTLNIKNREYTN